MFAAVKSVYTTPGITNANGEHYSKPYKQLNTCSLQNTTRGYILTNAGITATQLNKCSRQQTGFQLIVVGVSAIMWDINQATITVKTSQFQVTCIMADL